MLPTADDVHRAPETAVGTDLRDIGPVSAAFMGTLFLGGGLTILGVALGWIHVDPDSVHVPHWVLGVCGATFALPGVGMFFYGFIDDAPSRSGRGRGA